MVGTDTFVEQNNEVRLPSTALEVTPALRAMHLWLSTSPMAWSYRVGRAMCSPGNLEQHMRPLEVRQEMVVEGMNAANY